MLTKEQKIAYIVVIVLILIVATFLALTGQYILY